ncbi:hypothetical protein B0H14DRAFT_2558867 [Mycena olivaceomarginata]|nr:hypothetical protein B0H14DRAFT_2558867 [Mycena olivaceomarginata]
MPALANLITHKHPTGAQSHLWAPVQYAVAALGVDREAKLQQQYMSMVEQQCCASHPSALQIHDNVLGVNVDVVPDAVMNVRVFFFVSTPPHSMSTKLSSFPLLHPTYASLQDKRGRARRHKTNMIEEAEVDPALSLEKADYTWQ